MKWNRFVSLSYDWSNLAVDYTPLMRHEPVFINFLEINKPWINFELKDNITDGFGERSLGGETSQSIGLSFTPILFLLLVFLFIFEALIPLASFLLLSGRN